MGSCISKTSKKPHASPPPPPPPPQSSKHHHFQDRTLVPESDPPPSLPRKSTATPPPKRRPQPPPPPPIIEEETVKEVLSETPAAKPSIHRFQQNPKILRLPSFPKLEEHKNRSNEEISELSEICSVADSVSTSALTEQSRDYEEVLQQQQPRMIDRSPSKIRRKRTESGESYSRGESPVRKPEQWLSPGQTSRQWSISQNQNGVVRDQGESSRRRSRSPVTRIDSGVSRPGVCRSPSGKRGGRSAGRSPVPASEIARNLDDARDGKRPVKESLEDPLVSLECFIFL